MLENSPAAYDVSHSAQTLSMDNAIVLFVV